MTPEHERSDSSVVLLQQPGSVAFDHGAFWFRVSAQSLDEGAPLCCSCLNFIGL